MGPWTGATRRRGVGRAPPPLWSGRSSGGKRWKTPAAKCSRRALSAPERLKGSVARKGQTKPGVEPVSQKEDEREVMWDVCGKSVRFNLEKGRGECERTKRHRSPSDIVRQTEELGWYFGFFFKPSRLHLCTDLVRVPLVLVFHRSLLEGHCCFCPTCSLLV